MTLIQRKFKSSHRAKALGPDYFLRQFCPDVYLHSIQIQNLGGLHREWLQLQGRERRKVHLREGRRLEARPRGKPYCASRLVLTFLFGLLHMQDCLHVDNCDDPC